MKIQELKLFNGLTEDELQRSLVCSQSNIVEYEKDDYIFSQGERPRWIYMILSGEVLLEQINMAGRQTYAEYLGERQQFGVVDLSLKRKQYSYSARARSHVKLLKISSHFFYGTCENNCMHHSKILFNMMGVFAEEAEKKSKKIQLLTCGSLRQRIALYLLQNSGENKKVELMMNREELAASLNAARPSLSRELSQMQDEGIIKMEGRKSIKILDYSRLQEDLADVSD